MQDVGSDAVSIDLLIREHSAFVARLARRLLADPGDAEDLTQDAWRVVLERRPRGITDFRAWITGLLRNLARMRLRADGARRAREAAAARPAAAPSDEAAARLDEMERLVRALRRLREPFRTVVLLRYREGATPRAIARRTGVPIETVKSRLKRGLALLRADLRTSHGGDEDAWRCALGLVVLGRGLRETRSLLAAAGAAAALVTVAVLWTSFTVNDARRAAPATPVALRATAGSSTPAPMGDRVAITAPPTPTTVNAHARTLRVVDATTGEPVPEFVVAAPALDPPLRVSDAEGRLHLGTAADAVVELRLLDDLRLDLERPIHGELAQGELRVHVGPTYRLRLSPPPLEHQLFDARLVALDPARQYRTAFAPVRGDADPWVRFGVDATRLDGGPPWRLEIRSDDGHAFGWAEVHSVRGSQQEPIAVMLAATGRLVGHVEEPDGNPVDQAEIELEAGDLRFATVTDRSGAFDVPWLPPATWVVRVRSRLHAPHAAEAVVAAHATTEFALTLHAAPTHGTIAGVLVREGGSAAPAVPGPVAVVLTSPDDPELSFVQSVACTAPPEPVLAAFRFERVPAGVYDLTVRAADFVRWQPTSLRVACGDKALVLRRLDAEPVADVALRAIDAQTGAPITEFDAFVHLDGAASGAKVLAATDGLLLLRNVPVDARIEWTIRAPGCVPARGDRAAAGTPIRLATGWGNVVRCIDARGRPTPGLDCLADGTLQGTTDAQGSLHLDLDARPERLRFRDRRGREVPVLGDVFTDGRFRDLLWGITAITGPAAPPPEPTQPTDKR